MEAFQPTEELSTNERMTCQRPLVFVQPLLTAHPACSRYCASAVTPTTLIFFL